MLRNAVISLLAGLWISTGYAQFEPIGGNGGLIYPDLGGGGGGNGGPIGYSRCPMPYTRCEAAPFNNPMARVICGCAMDVNDAYNQCYYGGYTIGISCYR